MRLHEEFPVLFSQPCGFWCEEGWFGLIRDLSAEITAIAQRDGLTVVAMQVKEEFGGLCFCLEDRTTPQLSQVVDAAERRSLTVCELTGEPGRRCKSEKGFDYRALSPYMATVLGYDPVPPLPDDSKRSLGVLRRCVKRVGTFRPSNPRQAGAIFRKLPASDRFPFDAVSRSPLTSR